MAPSLRAPMTASLLAPQPCSNKNAGQEAFSLASALSGTPLEHAGHAALDLGALQRHLTQPDVVERLDPLAPGVDLRLVHVAGGGGVLEEQRQREPLRSEEHTSELQSRGHLVCRR